MQASNVLFTGTQNGPSLIKTIVEFSSGDSSSALNGQLTMNGVRGMLKDKITEYGIMCFRSSPPFRSNLQRDR